MAATSQYTNPYNPPEAQAGGDFAGMAKAFHEDHEFQAITVESAMATSTSQVLTETQGIYLIQLYDDDLAAAFDETPSGVNYGVALVYFDPGAGVSGAGDIKILAGTNSIVEAGLTTAGQINLACASGALSIGNYSGVEMVLKVSKIG